MAQMYEHEGCVPFVKRITMLRWLSQDGSSTEECDRRWEVYALGCIGVDLTRLERDIRDLWQGSVTVSPTL